MTIRYWRLIVLLALLLFTNVGAEAQKGARRVFEESYRAAARELARNDPKAEKELKERKEYFQISDRYESLFREGRLAPSSFNFLKTDEVTQRLGTTFNQQIGGENFRLKYSELSGRGTSRPKAATDLDVGRKLVEIMHRNQILKEMGAKEIHPLETRRLDKQAKTQLEAYLEKVGVTDYAVVAKSFDVNATAMRFVFKKEVILLRIFGGESKPIGRYLFCCLENTENAPPSVHRFTGQYARWTDASGLATPPGNLLEDLALVRLPAGTEVIGGVVADNFEDPAGNYRLGGNTQFFLPAVKDFPYEHYRLAGMVSDPSDIVVQFDGDTILRFRRSSSLHGPTR